MKFFVLLLSVLFLVTTVSFGQTEVDIRAAQFLEISPSVQSIGMGEASAATTVRSAMYYNPAALGFIGMKNEISFSIFPTKTKYSEDFSLQNLSLTFPVYSSIVGTRTQTVTIGVYYTRFTATLYANPLYEWYDIKETATNVLCSYAYENRIQFSLGVAFKRIDENIFDLSSNGVAFDFGFLLRYPIYFSNGNYPSSYTFYIAPAIGFALKNYGPDMEYTYTKYPLPDSRILGFAYEIGLRKFVDARRELDAFRILTAYDIEFSYNDTKEKKIGAEFSLFEFFNIRVGESSIDGTSNKTHTLGYTLSSDRLGKFLLLTQGGMTNSGFIEFITEKINLEYNYAKESNDFYDDRTYHELVLSYHL